MSCQKSQCSFWFFYPLRLQIFGFGMFLFLLFAIIGLILVRDNIFSLFLILPNKNCMKLIKSSVFFIWVKKNFNEQFEKHFAYGQNI